HPLALVLPEAATPRPRARRGGHRPLATLRVPAHPPAGATTRRAPGVPGRIGLFPAGRRASHLGAARPDADPARLGPARPPFGHQCYHRQPGTPAPEPVLP